MRTVYWILAGCFFTASFDLILLIDTGGSIRISQFLMGFVCLAALARVIQDGRILWPRGGTALAVWLLSQLIFLPLSGVLSIGLRFFALLAFTIAGVFALLQLYGKSMSLEPLMRIYLLSYAFVGLFGLVQFLLPIVGGPSILVVQWLLHGKLARINGFSYEPSYFATYLIMGWIMLVELRVSKAEIVSGRLWKWTTIALTLSLALSSSRTAWVFMLVELLSLSLPILWSGFRNAVRQMAGGRLSVPLPNRYFVLKAVFLVVAVVAAVRSFTKLVDPVQLLSGTGLAGTAAHSTEDRSRAASETFDAFLDHPFIGHSLGGVPIYLASRNGLQVRTMDEVRNSWGFPVILDVLVASGIIGIIPFLVFVYANTFGALRMAKRYWPLERAKWVRSLARAMIFECLLLMADQNLLRVYLWFHVSMVTLFVYNLEFGMESEPATSGSFPGLVPEAIRTT